MFWYHALSVTAFQKVRLGMYKIIIGRDRTGKKSSSKPLKCLDL